MELFWLEHKKLWRKKIVKICVLLCFVYCVIFGSILSFQWFCFGSSDDYTSAFGNNFDGYTVIKDSQGYALSFGGELTDETLQQIVSDYQQMEADGMEKELEKTDWQIVNSWLGTLYPELRDTSNYKTMINQSYQGYSLYTSSDTERRYFGNVMGASENFWADMRIFEGEKDAETLTQKMATGEYVIIGCPIDKLTEEPNNTPLTDQLQVGESISFYKDGELVKTSTILAKAILVGTETETPTGTTAQAHIAGDAPFVYLPDTVFKEIYDAPTLLTYGFNVEEALQPQMEEFLSSYVSENTSVAYTSTKLLKEQLDSVRSMILVIGGLIGCIMAFAGLINFTNMIITNIITRRHEFATMQSIGMTGKQLRRLMVYEGIYYAAGADIIGGAAAAVLAVTVLKSALNGPSMWFFTLNITLVPVLVIGVLYLLLAAVIPLIVLHFFNKGTVVERLRTSE